MHHSRDLGTTVALGVVTVVVIAPLSFAINATPSEIQRTPVLAAKDSNAISVVLGSFPSPNSQMFTLTICSIQPALGVKKRICISK